MARRVSLSQIGMTEKGYSPNEPFLKEPTVDKNTNSGMDTLWKRVFTA